MSGKVRMLWGLKVTMVVPVCGDTEQRKKMLRLRLILAIFGLVLAVWNAPAAVRYVDLNSASPVAPFTSWATAATNIQDAIDAASPGDTVLVTNGIYQTGGRAVAPYALTNRVVVDKAVTVQSVNGPNVTIIKGNPMLGDSAVRCVYLTHNAILTGFTLTNGATRTAGEKFTEENGGAVWCEGPDSVVSNCIVAGSTANNGGGGAFQGNFIGCSFLACSATLGGGACNAGLSNCIVSGNSSVGGGGVFGCNVTNSTISSNSVGSETGGGARFCNLTKCMIRENTARVGGGAADCTLFNCQLVGNRTINGGPAGGASSSTLYNCSLAANTAESYGGGAAACDLFNCSVTGNSAGAFGGGVDGCNLYNSIVYFNSAPGNSNHSGSSFNFCDTDPLPAAGTNICIDPLVVDGLHVAATSPCIGAGNSNYSSGVDIDGESWGNPPSMGSDEYISGAVTGPLTVRFPATGTTVATNFLTGFRPIITGHVSLIVWDFGDGTLVTNVPVATHAWSSLGDYPLVVTIYNDSNTNGVSATNLIHAVHPENVTYFVSLASTNPIPPFTSWETAATNIQDAADIAIVPGSLILVSNGVYRTGGRIGPNNFATRLVVKAPIRVSSVNGPTVTTIQGEQPFSPSGACCVALYSNAVLSGFTLTNGTSAFSRGPASMDMCGGGVWCESTNEVVSNCIVVGNRGSFGGGGVYRGTLYGCIIAGNNGGPYDGGGGAYRSVLINSLLISNFTGYAGGGARSCVLVNCTVTGNSAGTGGGTSSCTVNNSIVTSNNAGINLNFDTSSDDIFSYSCTSPLPTNGVGNITNDPVFVDFPDANFRLQSNSPCINIGNNLFATSADLDGRTRIVGGTVDMGAYEFQTAGLGEFLGWLEHNQLATDGSADSADSDNDGLSNWQEWRAGTVPTNAASALIMGNPTNSGSNVVVTWQSVTNHFYYLERSGNLNAPVVFAPLATNIVGQTGTTSFTDTNAAVSGPWYYRVGVQ